jgi:hypothetical protein
MPVTQEIRFDCVDSPITSKQAHAIAIFSSRFPSHDLRVSDDGGTLKIYVGEYYKEEYRFWVTDKGIRPDMLVEKDLAVGEEDSNWDKVDRTEAEVALSRIPEVASQGATFRGLEQVDFKNRQDAAQVLAGLERIIDQYGFASVADYYDLVGVIGQFTDNKFGWVSLAGTTIKDSENLYALNLPPVEPYKV